MSAKSNRPCGYCGGEVIEQMTLQRRRFMPGPKDYEVRRGCTRCGRTAVVKGEGFDLDPKKFLIGISVLIAVGAFFNAVSPPTPDSDDDPNESESRSNTANFGDGEVMILKPGTRIYARGDGGVTGTIQRYTPQFTFKDGQTGPAYLVKFSKAVGGGDDEFLPARAIHVFFDARPPKGN